MMIKIIIGNIIALIACIIMAYTGIIKEKRRLLLFQTIQIGLLVISNIILDGLSGAIVNTISFFRNILCYKNKLNVVFKTIISVITIYLIIIFNNRGIIGYLPLFSTIVYLWLMDIKDVIKFKYLVIYTLVLWGIYDLYIMSYTSAIFDLLTIIFNIIAIININKGVISNEQN